MPVVHRPYPIPSCSNCQTLLGDQMVQAQGQFRTTGKSSRIRDLREGVVETAVHPGTERDVDFCLVVRRVVLLRSLHHGSDGGVPTTSISHCAVESADESSMVMRNIQRG